MASYQSLTIRHWLPIVTLCPVSKFPDLIYVSISFDTFQELYYVRRVIRRELRYRTIFMEDAARRVKTLFPEATKVTVNLLFSRHTVTIEEF